MFWSTLLWITIRVIRHFLGFSDPVLVLGPPSLPHEITPVGPLSWEDSRKAYNALHGDPHGDMRHDPEGEHPFGGMGLKDDAYRWHGYPGKPIIPYVIDSSVAKLTPLIKRAMDQYHEDTCVKFVERKDQKDYVKIFKGIGCWSNVGMLGGNQSLSLGDGCEYVGTIVHELGHTVGLYHEQQRSDRAGYINIFMKNVEPGYESNFNQVPYSDELKFTAYDCDSIMQYGEYAFSKNPGKLKTMEGRKADCKLKEPFQKPGLTIRDIDIVRKMYQCY